MHSSAADHNADESVGATHSAVWTSAVT